MCTGGVPCENTRIFCNVVPEATCEAYAPQCGKQGTAAGKFGRALRTTFVDPASSRYIAACVTYFFYALGVLLVDIYAYGGYQDGGLFGGTSGGVEMTGSFLWDTNVINPFWLVLGAIHFVRSLRCQIDVTLRHQQQNKPCRWWLGNVHIALHYTTHSADKCVAISLVVVWPQVARGKPGLSKSSRFTAHNDTQPCCATLTPQSCVFARRW